MVGDGRELACQCVDDSVELGLYRVGVGLVVHAVQEGTTHGQDDFGVVDIRFAA